MLALRPKGAIFRASSAMATSAPDTCLRQKAYVRYKPGEDNMTISLTVGGRQRNLNRPITELLEKPLARLRANLAPEKGKKVKKKAKTQDSAAPVEQAGSAQGEDLRVELYEDEDATRLIPGSTRNQEAWTRGSVLRLGPQLFELTLNPPTVESLSLQRFAMVGYPLLPTLNLSFCHPGATQWKWSRHAKREGELGERWEDTGCREMRYTPTEADLGCMLRVECLPGRWDEGQHHHHGGPGSSDNTNSNCSIVENSGNCANSSSSSSGNDGISCSTADAAAAVAAGSSSREGHQHHLQGEVVAALTGPVGAGPPSPAAEVRVPGDSGATPVMAPGFRVMSYNILADQYAGTAYAQQVLFDYCPTELLDNQYRRQLVLQEVIRYQGGSSTVLNFL